MKTRLTVVACLLLCTSLLQAATNQPPFPQRTGIRTNALQLNQRPRTNIATAVRPGAPTVAGKTNAPAGAKPTAQAGSTWKDTWLRLRAHRAFYPALAAIGLGLAALVAFFVSRAKTKPAPGKSAALAPAPLSSKLAVKPSRRKRPVTYHACNVLEVGTEARQVWQFDARGRGYAFGRHEACLDGQPLPSGLVAKDWRTLFQHKLNIAWLPPEHVFLRVAQLPRSDFEETLSMVELQLEKLSPIPVAQIVWSFHVLPHSEGNLQTVIVSMVARSVVEEFLGKLEGQGYLADRLELPLFDQLQTTAITEDGAWVYPEAAGGKGTAVVAWWYGGVLRNLDLLMLPPGDADRAASLKEQLMQMAWAGEMEGWLTGPPEWHLVADVAAAEWGPALRAGLELPIETITPVPIRDLAALTATRSAQGEPRANLMPPEFAIRYQQQFVDRLWMRGLLGVGGAYTACVAIYLVALWFFNYSTTSIEDQVTALSLNYTNAVQLKMKFSILKDRQDLKYAGLDCWNATAHLLPDNVSLDSLNFSEGRRLHLSGNAPENQFQRMLDFERDMHHETMRGDLLFSDVAENLQWRAPGPTATWGVGFILRRSETQ